MAESSEGIEPGARVEVRTGFDRSWVRGFEVIAEVDGRYRLRRCSDGMELPVLFTPDDVRPERRRTNDMWWY